MKALNLNKWIAVLALLPLVLGSQAKGQNFVCPGTEYCITLDDTRGSEQWEMSTDNITFNPLMGQTGDTLCITPTMSGFYRAVILSEPGCDPVFSDTIELQLSTLTIDAGADVTICDGESVIIGGTPAVNLGSPPYTVTWTGAALSDPTLQNPVASPTSSDSPEYILNVVDNDGCTLSDTVNVTALPLLSGTDTFLVSSATSYEFVVPQCRANDSITVELWGAAGENTGSGTNIVDGGAGGYIRARILVSGLDTIGVVVGSNNTANTGGAAGGGNLPGGRGGGASYVYLNLPSTPSADTVLVAGGGGGAGGNVVPNRVGGAGGNGGLIPTAGGASNTNTTPILSQAAPGQAGASNPGGPGGAGMQRCDTTAAAGMGGQAFTGGAGGDGVIPGVNSGCSFANTAGLGGGGGGGGRFGGGGGGGGVGSGEPGAGGGGGSSFFEPTAVTLEAETAGANDATGPTAGQGLVIIHW